MEQNTQPTAPQAAAPATNEIAAALAKAQGGYKKVTKSRTATVKGKSKDGTPISYSYNYADLADMVEAIREPFAANGLAFYQTIEGNGGVTTYIIHSSGQRLRTWVPLHDPAGQGPQAFGSVLTYARRYGLGMGAGLVAEEDDDGQAGEGEAQNARGAARPRPSTQGAPKAPPRAPAAPTGQPDANRTASTPPPRNQDTTKQGDWDKASPGWEDHPATQPQIKRMFALAKLAGYADEAQIKSMLFEVFGDAVISDDGKDVTTKKITKGMMEKVYARLDNEKKSPSA